MVVMLPAIIVVDFDPFARHDMGLYTVIGNTDKDAKGQKLDALIRSTMGRLRTWDHTDPGILLRIEILARHLVSLRGSRINLDYQMEQLKRLHISTEKLKKEV